ncbi:3-ketoacyl-ACP reductase [Enterococcus silesiacus]|uniref:3-ketoacyl-(Acyl-carrier-protein) reductase n=1 Tax=Enterococcus silesiacus TaxID=332949 RepID=A0A0S3K745_9ENTE|nr:3-oxoacyl-ACP reductase [Enterococcus silesiacus]ALS00106.1 3-ketoacyl-ACP reductase [Enterococcus silesiacus]OJG90963.1 3-ketoacyl-(acyl-carrier-protein) reductase [Enterococcus silesiacus]
MQFTEYQGKTIFVTGAASGIGQAQVLAFVDQGANVFGMDLDAIGLAQTFAKTTASPGKFLAYTGDITKKNEISSALEEANKSFGPIHILLNTAGILDNYTPTLETTEALWDDVLSVNLKGTFLVTNQILPQMLQQKHGVVINMASIAGMVAGGGGAAYTASKHAIIGYTKQLDYDYIKQGIRANAIAPGAIQTPMNAADFAGDGKMAAWVANETPAGRWAKPEEVAALTLFLASQQADYIHGTVMTIDGGWLEK